MIPGIILAAGDSSRMGRPKALLSMGSSRESFLDRIVAVLREGGVEDVVVVLGRDADAIRAAAAGESPPVRFVDNTRYAEGQLSSLLAGLRAVDRPGVRAALVTLVDLPLLTSDTVRSILTAYRHAGGAAIVRPTKEGRHGHPVIFDRTLFQELQRADPASGARSVIHAHHADILDVEVTDEGAFIDIDTPADYQRLVLPR
jgi:CTP:molybdopterin cytidylyltransferase MocA